MATTETIISLDIMNNIDGNPHDNNGNAGGAIAASILIPIVVIKSSTAVAIVTVIVCRKKKIFCFVNLEKKLMLHLKKCYVGCKKEESSDLRSFLLED